jgi:HSP20 family molecular chaperone IbpA
MSFDDFFNPFYVSGEFERPFKEVNRIKCYNREGQDVIVANTLGVSKNDIKVSLKDLVLSIAGKTNNEYTGENSVDYQIRVGTGKTIKKITYKVEDGYTYVFIKYAQVENSPTIEYIK